MFLCSPLLERETDVNTEINHYPAPIEQNLVGPWNPCLVASPFPQVIDTSYPINLSVPPSVEASKTKAESKPIVIGDRKVFNCPHCLKIYCTSGGLMKHVCTKHAASIDQSDLENMKEENLSESTELDNSDFVRAECLNCKRKFTSIFSLDVHMERCRKNLNSVEGLKSEVKIEVKKEDQPDVKEPKLKQVESSPPSAVTWKKQIIARVNKQENKIITKIGNSEYLKVEKLEDPKEHVKMENPEKSPQYACTICHVMISKESFSTHVEEHKNWCTTCNRGFLSRKDLESHKLEHNKVYPYTCDICQHKYASLKCLMNHQKRMASNPTHGALKKTRMTPDAKTKFHCGVCKQGFADRSSLNAHKKEHQERRELPFVCVDCDRGYMTRGDLTRHRRMKHGHKKQHGETKVEPDVMIDRPGPSKHRVVSTVLKKGQLSSRQPLPRKAKKMYPLPNNATKAKKSEDKNMKAGKEMVRKEPKPGKDDQDSNTHTCSVCSKKFTDAEKYKRHLQVHKNNKYFCSKCPKVFLLKKRYDRHISEKHSFQTTRPTSSGNLDGETNDQALNEEVEVKSGVIKCPHCPSFFGRPFSLKVHMTDKHPVQVANNLANEAVRRLSAKKKKSASSTHKTNDESDKKESKQMKMKKIEEVKEEGSSDRLTCQVCFLKFTDELQFESHINLHPEYMFLYRCAQCWKLFVSPGHLDGHIETKHSLPRLQCIQCEKTFRSTKYYEDHMESHRLRQLECRSCGKGFLKQSSLTQHEKIHRNRASAK